ncbi:MAG: MMPL family transporter [Terracidiphilus sp.]|jgi:predicted RND superfamily exporter protein
MMVRFMRGLGGLVINHPGWVAGVAFALTLFLYANIHNLRTGTELTDMFGSHDPQWQAASQIGKELGYGNQLFVLVQAQEGEADSSEAMEAMADRLTAEMSASGLFKQARCGLREEELINLVRLFTWHFPSYALPDQQEALEQRLDPRRIHQNVRQSATELVTPFSTLGADYFIADPLGLMSVTAGNGEGFSQFSSFDLSWGSGNRFFSRDHKALLIIAEPRESAVDYKYAEQIMQWTHSHIQSIEADPELRSAGVSAIPAGAYVYAEQDHKFIERNIRRVSLVAIVGSLLLCLVVYPSVPLLLLSLLPTSLGILWTTGIASYYPGEVNLISLSFIAILAGLGDDQVVHFFNRSPQEWGKGGSFNAAMLRTFETTGLSIVLCILTAASATAALATSSFKALAEFGFILTVGMFMMMLHTLLTVPALMQLWNRHIRPFAPAGITFRFLPALARGSLNFVGRHARWVVAVATGLFVISAILLPTIKMGGSFAVIGDADSPAVAAQNLLSAKFGIEGSPTLLLIAGGEQEVLRRSENLSAGLESYRQSGVLKSVFSPTQLLPSIQAQKQRSAALSHVDMNASARALEDALRENGLRIEPYQPYLAQLRKLGKDAEPITLESAGPYLPAGMLDNSLRKTKDGNYVAAIAYYTTGVNAHAAIPDAVLDSWRGRYGPFVEFSFDKINRDIQSQVLLDSRRALLLTAAAILLIVYLTFRNLRITLLVLMPIVFAIVVTFGLLQLAGHAFSFMAVTAIPLIIGIGIDNGIHLVRRYLEKKPNNILDVAKASGAALIQSNLTTIIGFGALLAATFPPLAEMGLVTSLGVALTLAGGLWVIPAVILIGDERQAVRGAVASSTRTQSS